MFEEWTGMEIPWLKINNPTCFFCKITICWIVLNSEPRQDSSRISRSQKWQNRWISYWKEEHWLYSVRALALIGSIPVCLNLFVFFFLVTSCLVLAFQPLAWSESQLKKKFSLMERSFTWYPQLRFVSIFTPRY